MDDSDAFAALDAISFDSIDSEEAMLELMRSWEPLPLEDDPEWEDYESSAWVTAFSLIGAADVS